MREMLSTLDWSVAGQSCSCKMARRQSKDSAFVHLVDLVHVVLLRCIVLRIVVYRAWFVHRHCPTQQQWKGGVQIEKSMRS
jgi:hypothetical protein